MKASGDESSSKDQPKSAIYTYQIPTAPVVTVKEDDASKKKVNLWRQILSNVAKREDLKDSYLLLLGDKGCGKRSLVKEIDTKVVLSQNKHMNAEQMGSDFAALNFSFLYVKDLCDKEQADIRVTTEDNLPRLNIWTLQDSEKGDLFESVLKPNDLANTVATIVLSLDTPWEMMQQLSKWLKVLQRSLFTNMLPKMEAGLYEKMKKKIETHIKTYEDPQVDSSGKLVITTRAKADGSDNEEPEDIRKNLALGEGVLKVNLGIPIIVICNKVDLLFQGEKAKYLAENLDFIQQSIREYALQYGATVIFTSTLANKNLRTYYQYMLHRLYDFEFPHPANLVDKDNLFLPAGFDSLKQIEALKKGIIGTVGPDGQPLSYEDVIKPPHLQGFAKASKAAGQAAFVECPEWQTLL